MFMHTASGLYFCLKALPIRQYFIIKQKALSFLLLPLPLIHASSSDSSCWLFCSLRKSMSLYASSPLDRSTKSRGIR
uniref:Uncharacterized protein n=1 Tax=Anguilla anguilla TaxID=7936 RepID=A0A0E9X5A1_ANGAN